MHTKRILTACLLLLCFTSCHHNQNELVLDKNGDVIIPDVENIQHFKQTDFAVTLQSPLIRDKNIVYASSLTMAWDQLISTVGPITLSNVKPPQDLSDLANIEHYKSALYDKEFSADVNVDASTGNITVHTGFNLALAFEPEMQPNDTNFLFMGKKVKAFGMYNADAGIIDHLGVVSYKDDDHFILTISPKGGQDEMIFIKGITQPKNFKEVLDTLNAARNLPYKPESSWRHKFKDDDVFSIPVLSFNIEKPFESMIGQRIQSTKGTYTLTEVTQRNGFLLNEKGAKVESESLLQAAPAAMPPSEEKEIPKPKKLFLDKPFYIILKHLDRSEPYFMMQVKTPELMILAK